MSLFVNPTDVVPARPQSRDEVDQILQAADLLSEADVVPDAAPAASRFDRLAHAALPYVLVACLCGWIGAALYTFEFLDTWMVLLVDAALIAATWSTLALLTISFGRRPLPAIPERTQV